MSAMQPDRDSEVISTTQPNTASQSGVPVDTWRAAGINLYVLFLPASSALASQPLKTTLLSRLGRLLGVHRATSFTQAPLNSPTITGSASSNLDFNRFWYGIRRIEGWILHHVALPATVEHKRQVLIEIAVSDLPKLLHQMLTFARFRAGSAGSDVVGYLVSI